MMEEENKSMDHLIREHMASHDRFDFMILVATLFSALSFVVSVISLTIHFIK